MTRLIRTTGAVTMAMALLGTAPLMAQKGKPGGTASGVLKVLEIEADWTQNLPTSGAVYPAVCETEPHVAGPNEVAIIAMSGFLAPSGANNDYLQLRVAVSENWGPFYALNQLSAISGLSSGAAHLSTSKRLALVEGVTYIFVPARLKMMLRVECPPAGRFISFSGSPCAFRSPFEYR